MKLLILLFFLLLSLGITSFLIFNVVDRASAFTDSEKSLNWERSDAKVLVGLLNHELRGASENEVMELLHSVDSSQIQRKSGRLVFDGIVFNLDKGLVKSVIYEKYNP